MLEALSAGYLPCSAIGCGGEYAAKLGPDLSGTRSTLAKRQIDLNHSWPSQRMHLAKRQAARELTTQHSENEYFRIFDEFVGTSPMSRASHRSAWRGRFTFPINCPLVNDLPSGQADVTAAMSDPATGSKSWSVSFCTLQAPTALPRAG